MRQIAVFCTLCITVCAAAGAQAPKRLDGSALEEAGAAASKALDTFARLVNQSNFEELGFSSPGEVREATLGDPIEEFMIRLDALREYVPDQRGIVIDPVRRVTYPVVVGGAQRSSLTVGETGGRWTAVAFGGPNYARLLVEARRRLDDDAQGRARDSFELRVPALNISFVAFQDGDDLFVLPVLDDPRFDFGESGAIPLERALEALAPAARDHNGLPT